MLGILELIMWPLIIAITASLLFLLWFARPWERACWGALGRRLRFPLALALAYFLLSQLLRVVLVVLFKPAGAAPGELALLFLPALHVDAVVALVQSLPVALWCLLRRTEWTTAARRGLLALAGVWWFIIFFLFLSEYFFFEEFSSRFNTVAIDYLIYPHEVMTNMWESYNIPVILLTVAAGTVLVVWLAWRKKPALVTEGDPLRRRWGFVSVVLFLLATAVLTIRPAETAFSKERVINELANNGLAAGARAAWTRNLDYAAFYPSDTRDAAFARARKVLATAPEASFPFPPAPPAPQPGADGKLDPAAESAWLDAARASLQRRIAGDPARPKLNVVILLEESLGSEFFGSLGRVNKSGEFHTLTPCLDEIIEKDALTFDNLFADGNRTIRGFEGVFSSFPPLPGDAILARDRTENVETIARVLKRDGYQSLFLYGGHGTFDYVESYALPNGWDRLIEQNDFKNPTFTTAWGVCDEDLYNRTIEEMRALHATGKPFLVSCMTVSNHRPYTYPEGRIKEVPKKPKQSRENVVKYTDWALGDFFKKVKREPFWKDTIFVVVADHGARVYGSQSIPMKSYMIPCLIAGPAVVPKPVRVSTLGCQLDVAPTILGLIGRPYDSLFFGHDLMRQTAPEQSRCLMHHNRSIAIYRDQRQVVFGLNKSVEYWTGDPRSGTMSRTDSPDAIARELQLDGTALFQVADDLYMNRRYRVVTP